MNYIIDKACNVGKGANRIISMLHHFLKTHGLGKTHLHLHANNCSGQNKNRYMMGYLMWRVQAGLNEEITTFVLKGPIQSRVSLCKICKWWTSNWIYHQKMTFLQLLIHLDTHWKGSGICTTISENFVPMIPEGNWKLHLLLHMHIFPISACSVVTMLVALLTQVQEQST